MTTVTTPSQTQLAALFDRILSRIEAGEVQRAIAHLGGLFDAALLHCGEPAAIRAVLHNHPLSAALRQPILAAELAQLDGKAAQASRADLARSWCASAARRGQRWIDLDRVPMPSADARFELILAASLADSIRPDALVDGVSHLASCLAAQGRLVLSAFLPGHLGWGWQTIWQDRAPQRHDPAALCAAAASAGLTTRLFHDAGGMLVWAEMSRQPAVTGDTDG